MNAPIRAKLLPLAVAAMLAGVAVPALAQETSASLSGRVIDAAGKPVANATVQIVHEPSGTSKTTTTDADGRYSAQGLRVGGPFDVTVNGSGGSQVRQYNVYLALGTDTPVNLTLTAGAAQEAKTLGAVTVSAVSGPFASDNQGLSTHLGQRDIKLAPTPSRNLADIARRDPRVTVDHGTGAISANGQNARLNSLKVDGLGVGDPFGLNGSGLPTVGSPVSVDTIEGYNISTANYDVISDSVGVELNAVTKSGTNDPHGTVYYAYKNANDMVGKAGFLDNNRDYREFGRNWTAGATFGGPIIKDKLFFFGSVEKEKITDLSSGAATGLDPTIARSTSNKISQADLQRVINAANALNIVPGTIGANAGDLKDMRYLGKIDWNITDGHRASFAYQQTKETKPNPQGNSASSVGLSSYWYTVNTNIKNYTLQTFDDWSDIFSSETKLGYSDFDLYRSVVTQQPQITVSGNNLNQPTAAPTSPTVNLGEDQFSHYNRAKVRTFTAFWAGTLTLGDHAIKGGFDFERNNVYNLFGRTEFGAYSFYSIPDIEAGRYDQYNLYRPAPGYSLNDIAAKFQYKDYTWFLQDTWQVNDKLVLNYGVRVNKYVTGDQPIYNPTFQQRFGFSNTQTINGSRLVEPRLSFNYAFDSQYKTQLRGGVGLFQSTPPTVWITNPYQNNGVNIVTYQYNRQPNGSCNLGSGKTAQNGPCPAFSADPLGQNTGGAGIIPQQAVDTIQPNFQLPSVWKSSLAFDRELPWLGIIGTLEYEHLQARHAFYYQNLNIGAPTGILPDGRFTYNGCIGGAQPVGGATGVNCRTGTGANPNGNVNAGQARFRQDARFAQGVTELLNSDKGQADSVTLSFTKPFADGWSASIAGTASHATEVNPGTSSQATSNFSNNAWYNPNEDKASTSNTNIARRLNASLSWQHNFFGDYATTASLFYDGHSGVPYSWVFSTDANGDSYRTDLAYVPRPGDVNFAAGTQQAVIDQFYDYIQHDDYLKHKQGKVVRRNGAEAAWVNQLDFSFSQEIPGLFKGNKGEIRLDVYNVLNALNKDWGQQSYIGFPYTRNLAGFAGVGPDGKYIYTLPTDAAGNYQPGLKTVYDAPTDNSATKANPVSRWSVLATVRYTF